MSDIATLQLLHTLTPNSSFNSLLEIGCFDGELLRLLNRYLNIKLLCGLDIQLDAVKCSYANLQAYNNFNIVLGDGRTLPFRENSFDVVIASELLWYLDPMDDICSCISEMIRVSKKYIISYDYDKKKNAFNGRILAEYISARLREIISKFWM